MKKIIILEGGFNEEHEVSINTSIEVQSSLKRMKYSFEIIRVDPNDFEEKIEEILKDILINKSDYLKKKENLKKLNYQNTWNNVNQKILKIINEN